MTTRDPDRRPKHAAGDGEVPPWWSALDRRRLAVALGSTFVAVPVVVLDNLPQHESRRAEAQEVVAADASSTTTSVPPSSTTVTVETTTTTEAPTTTATTEAPTTTTTASPRSTTTTTTAPPETTTTAAPAPTATAAPAPAPEPAPANTESGKATWYRYRDGECAHKTLPRGTVVHIRASNGRTATCTVTDRGPYGSGRIIDLDDDTFAQLAPLSAGVIDVTISW